MKNRVKKLASLVLVMCSSVLAASASSNASASADRATFRRLQIR